MRKKRKFWSKEICFNEALKYDTRTKFSKGSCCAYEILRKNGWLDDACKHMKMPYEVKFIWSLEKCKAIALKYQHRKEFQSGDNNAYCAAKYNGWLDDICKHMKPIGDRYNKCIYSYEFSDNHVYVGLTHNINIRQKNRDRDLTDTVTKYINETNLTPIRKQLTDYIFVDDAIRLEEEFLQKYLNEGWVGLNKRKTGGIGSKKRLSTPK